MKLRTKVYRYQGMILAIKMEWTDWASNLMVSRDITDAREMTLWNLLATARRLRDQLRRQISST